MDQLITFTTRAFLFFYLIVVATREGPMSQLPVHSILITSFKCPSGVDVSCRSEEPAIFNNLSSFLAAGGLLTSTCGIDTASFNVNSTFLSNVRCNKTTSTVYSINDSCGGSANCIHVITVKDQTPPVGFCPGVTLHCEDPEPDTIKTYTEFIHDLNSATPVPGYVADNCGLDTTTFTFVKITKEYSSKCLTAIIQQYTIFDSCQNGIICSQRFTILDDKFPSFTPSRDTILYLNGSCFADTSLTSLGTIQTPMDNCGIDSIYYVDHKKPGCVQAFASFDRIWRVVDNCKNATVDTQHITIRDTSKPVISGPPGFTVLCSSDVPVADTNLIFANDNCSNLVTRFFVKDSVADSTCANNKIINRIYSASDPCRNTAYYIQRIIIKDSLPPTVTCPDSLKVSCIALVPGKNPNLATAVDLCDGIMRIQIKDSVINQGCVNKQTIYRIFNSIDTCQNSARCIQVITVKDLNPPSLTCPPDTLVTCMSALPPVNPNRVIGVDNCSSSINISFQKDSTVNIVCNNKKTTFRFYVGVDSCNNMSRCRQTITVNDQTPPLIISFPKDTQVDCNSNLPSPNPSLVTTSDNCGGMVIVSHLKDSVVGQICVNNKKVYRIYIANDDCGNSFRRTQLITVLDTIPPLLLGPSNTQVLLCGAPYTVIIPTALDNCVGVFSVTTSSRVVDSSCIGNYKIIYSFSATDSCNNITSRSDTVTYQDNTPPSITCPPDQLVECIIPVIEDIDSFTIKGGSIYDLCGIDSNSFKLVKQIYTQVNDQIINTRTYKIEDQCGNADSCLQQITSPVCFVDIALKKTINSPINPYLAKAGGKVPFCITVYNQGVVTADSIKIIEYFPAGGSQITSPGWINDSKNGTACIYLSRKNERLPATGLLPGTNVQICFLLQLSDTIRPGLTINVSEINEVRDTSCKLIPDIDSKADNDPTNDTGGKALGPDDDFLDGNSYLGEDEDDSDPALFFVLPELTCINNTYASASVDASCGHCFVASELLKGYLLPDSLYKVTLFDSYGNRLPSNCVGPELLGYTITYSVSLLNSPNNSCWGTVTLEDKAPPPLDCTNDTIDCIAYSQIIPLPVIYDNCSGRAEVTIVKEQWTDFGCTGGDLAGVLTRTLLTKDKWKNGITCDKNYFIRKVDIADIICPLDIILECPDTLNLNNPSITGAPVYNKVKLWPLNPTCNLFMTYEDQRVALCGAGFKIFRTWFIGDACTGQELKCVQVIKVEDHTAPVIDSINRSINLPADPHECFAWLDLKKLKVTDCSNTFQAYLFTSIDPEIPNKSKTFTGSIPSRIKIPKGINKIYIDIHDACNNYKRDSITVTVTDLTPPTPVCHSTIQLTLDPYECSSWISAKDLDNGSHDNCCSELHFAAAFMDEIDSARKKFVDKINSECGSKEYWDNKAWYDAYIEDWINCYIFKDTLLGSECGSRQVVLRVYEACDLPLYDPHVFPCSPHAWYCYNTSWRYRVVFNHEFRKGGNKSCLATGPIGCKNDLVTALNNLTSFSPGLYQSFPVYKNCDELFGTSLEPIVCSKKLYNNCMIQLLLDDKQKPNIQEIPTLTVYCDGVNIPQGESPLEGCAIQGEKYGNVPGAWPGEIKVKGYTEVFGYYAGSFYPSHEEHPKLTDLCSDQAYNVWAPVYCRKWLELDSFDSHNKNPYELFYKPVIRDKKHETRPLNANEFLVADNCVIDSLTYSDQKVINSCNEGWILRTWTAKDRCGNTYSSNQKILIKHRSDFAVLFPEDKLVDCELKQSADTGLTKAGIPILGDKDCEQIGIRYEDEIFYTEADACYKIVRTWTIIDWCIFDANQHEFNPDIIVNDSFRANKTDRICSFRYMKDNNDGYMKYIQIIKVFDHIAPKVKCENVELCVSEGCSLNINVPLNGEDNCSDTLNYRVDITYPNGSHERRFNIQSIKGSFVVGLYQVMVIGEDGCQNADTCSFTLNIKDCKIPTPYCINGIVTVIMPSSGNLEVWAKDLDLKSEDNCTPSNKLRFTFSKDLTDLSIKLSCKDIINGKEQSIPVQVWVTDEAGLQNFCSSYLLIQDNSGNICPDQAGATATLKGGLTTEQKEPIEFGNLTIKGQGTEGLPAFQTNADGTYYFGSLPLHGNYVVSATRNDNPLNGVSTLDLVLIQKHILGSEKLNSPYKMIAADVDGSNSITVVDLLELRKLVLGLYDKLPESPSWKFVPGSYQFVDPANPWGEAAADRSKIGYPLEENIQTLTGDLVKNFIGIKMGDVNSSSFPHSLLGTEIRSNPIELIFEVDDRQVSKGQWYKVAFRSPNFRGISGWQGTLSIGSLRLNSNPDVLNGELRLTKGNIGTRWINNGLLTLSWNETRLATGTNRDVAENKTLFEFEFLATQTGYLSDMLSMGSQHTFAESYEGRGEVGGLKIQFKDPISKKLILKNYMDQNYPNPFNHITTIGINLIQKCNGVLSIYDATGRVVYKMDKEWMKGYNQIQVDRNILGGKGMTSLYYYKFQSGSYTDIKKMLLVE